MVGHRNRLFRVQQQNNKIDLFTVEIPFHAHKDILKNVEQRTSTLLQSGKIEIM